MKTFKQFLRSRRKITSSKVTPVKKARHKAAEPSGVTAALGNPIINSMRDEHDSKSPPFVVPPTLGN